MKTYKLIDFWGSILLITTFSIMSFVKRDFTFITGYFAVGAWQLVSILVHTSNGWFNPTGSSRKFYHHAVSFLTAIVLIGFLFYPFIISITTILIGVVAVFLLFTAPLMAILYTIMCGNELKIIRKRTLIHLK